MQMSFLKWHTMYVVDDDNIDDNADDDVDDDDNVD